MAQPNFKTEVGTYRGRRYFVHLTGDPDLSDPNTFAAILYYRNVEREEQIEIARIDTAHGEVHFDRLYRRDEPKDTDVDFGPWEAMKHLSENWRRYAESYESK